PLQPLAERLSRCVTCCLTEQADPPASMLAWRRQPRADAKVGSCDEAGADERSGRPQRPQPDRIPIRDEQLEVDDARGGCDHGRDHGCACAPKPRTCGNRLRELRDAFLIDREAPKPATIS